MKILMMFVNLLNMYKVVWENIDIDIPLNDNTYLYYDMPKAYLYDSNDNLIETEVYYEKGVNHTSLNVVNSRHVKVFKINYRAHFDEYGISQTEMINFNIIDITPPEFLYTPEIIMPQGSKLLKEQEIIDTLIYKDNYYSNDLLTVRISGLVNVNVNIPGIYEIYYELMDPSLNVKRVLGYYVIENTIPPEIKSKDIIEINYGENFNYLDHFQFIDKYDSNLKTTVDLSNVNFNKIGLYQITVSAINKAGLKTIVTKNLKIVDKQKPNIVISPNTTFNIYKHNYNDLKTLIFEVTDNYDNLTIDDVIIEGVVDFNVINKYSLTYQVADSSNNVFSKNVIVEIKDLEKPKISLKDEIILNVGSSNPNWHKYFEITDNYDDFSDLDIYVNDKNVDYNKIGTYYIDVTVTDLSKLKTTKRFNIKIKDLISPQVTQVSEIIITDFLEKDLTYYKSFFEIEDNYNIYADIKITKEGLINYNKIGKYDVIFKFGDKSNNETTINTSVNVIDIIPPEINLNTNFYYYYIGDEIPNLESFINKISDNYFDDLKLNIKNNINYNEIGLYEVTYEVYDGLNNYSYETLNFYVDLRKSKLIEGSDLYLKINDNFIIGENIILSDDVVKTYIYPEKINTKNPGIKEITYIAYDKRGNYEVFTQNIYINEPSFLTKYKTNIIVTIISLITISGLIIYYKKYNNNSY